jgi:hypothetical protein
MKGAIPVAFEIEGSGIPGRPTTAADGNSQAPEEYRLVYSPELASILGYVTLEGVEPDYKRVPNTTVYQQIFSAAVAAELTLRRLGTDSLTNQTGNHHGKQLGAAADVAETLPRESLKPHQITLAAIARTAQADTYTVRRYLDGKVKSIEIVALFNGPKTTCYSWDALLIAWDRFKRRPEYSGFDVELEMLPGDEADIDQGKKDYAQGLQYLLIPEEKLGFTDEELRTARAMADKIKPKEGAGDTDESVPVKDALTELLKRTRLPQEDMRQVLDHLLDPEYKHDTPLTERAVHVLTAIGSRYRQFKRDQNIRARRQQVPADETAPLILSLAFGNPTNTLEPRPFSAAVETVCRIKRIQPNDELRQEMLESVKKELTAFMETLIIRSVSA